jgi:hypothetical protein
MRLGSVAAAPFVGDQFVSLYLGATRVPTVPGKPSTDFDGEDFVILPVNSGGSAFLIGNVNLYVNGVLEAQDGETFTQAKNYGFGFGPGDVLRAAWENEIGQGPLSDPFVVPAE